MLSWRNFTSWILGLLCFRNSWWWGVSGCQWESWMWILLSKNTCTLQTLIQGCWRSVGMLLLNPVTSFHWCKSINLLPLIFHCPIDSQKNKAGFCLKSLLPLKSRLVSSILLQKECTFVMRMSGTLLWCLVKYSSCSWEVKYTQIVN